MEWMKRSVFHISVCVCRLCGGRLSLDEVSQASWRRRNSITFSLEGREAALPGPTTSSCTELSSFAEWRLAPSLTRTQVACWTSVRSTRADYYLLNFLCWIRYKEAMLSNRTLKPLYIYIFFLVTHTVGYTCLFMCAAQILCSTETSKLQFLWFCSSSALTSFWTCKL